MANNYSDHLPLLLYSLFECYRKVNLHLSCNNPGFNSTSWHSSRDILDKQELYAACFQHRLDASIPDFNTHASIFKYTTLNWSKVHNRHVVITPKQHPLSLYISYDVLFSLCTCGKCQYKASVPNY